MNVKLESIRENTEIRYTINGSDCDVKSPLFTHPLVLKTSVVISARCFRNGLPVSGIITKKFRKVEANPGLNIVNPVPGITSSYYEGNWDSIPDFKKLNPVKEGISDNFSLEQKMAKEYYGFSFNGYILVPSNDVFAFYTDSDDGSILWIDGKKIVENDGLHGAKEVETAIALRKGYNQIRVDYFNKTGSDGLFVSIRSASMEKQGIPGRMLFH
jgi:hypothetical protein